ncbi:MAG: shikimate kinase, partial [Psychromonas sp.]
QDSQPPTRKSLVASGLELENFINANESWVIEGCYSDLLELVEQYATEIIFMDLSIDDCILNAKARPWEPHKYESKQAQDHNLAMLISWISQYTERTDTFSKLAHQSFYDNYLGKKISITSNGN